MSPQIYKPQPVTSALELARSLQLEMLDRPFDQRIPFAVDALRILSTCKQKGKPFFVEGDRAYIRPPEAFSQKNTLIAFGEVAIEGTFNGFSYLNVGEINNMPINSLCAAFHNIRFLPTGEQAGPDNFMYIPALAVGLHMQLAA